MEHLFGDRYFKLGICYRGSSYEIMKVQNPFFSGHTRWQHQISHKGQTKKTSVNGKPLDNIRPCKVDTFDGLA